MTITQRFPKIKKYIIDDAGYGDMFCLGPGSDVYMVCHTRCENRTNVKIDAKIVLEDEPCPGNGMSINSTNLIPAIRLKDGALYVFNRRQEVYPVDGTLEWEVTVDDNN